MQPYFEDALKELGYPLLTQEEVEVCYISFFVKQIAIGLDVKNIVYVLNEHPVLLGYESFYELYCIYHAWQDLDRGQPFSYEWEDATSENIEQHCINEARNWLYENYDFL